MNAIQVAPYLTISSKDKSTSLSFGPNFESIDIKRSKGRVSLDETLGFTDDEFKRRDYIGATLSFESNYVDNKVFPTYGFRLATKMGYLNVISKKEDLWEFSIAAHSYLPLIRNPKLVLANKVGYQKSMGDLQFYRYPDLGNTTNLRGFRNNRFRGESAFYHNIDLRWMLVKWDNDILPMDIGILGGFDYGRVWLEGENSHTWHNSQTAGLVFNILGVAIVHPFYSFTDEGNQFTLRLGFNF
jgi:outer membrane protein assembly factor BamA